MPKRAADTALAILLVTTAAAAAELGERHRFASGRMTDVYVEERDEDVTVVVATFDAPILGYRRFSMDGGEPRAVVCIMGIRAAYRPYEVGVGDERVRRIRIGHHPEYAPPEEHLVFDLADERVTITGVIEQGDRLTVFLARVSTPGAAKPDVPSPPAPGAGAPQPSASPAAGAAKPAAPPPADR